MLDELAELGRDLIGLIPETLLFLVILIVGFVVASLLKRGIDAVLTRVRASRWVDRFSRRTVDRPVRVDVAGIVASVVYWLVVLFTLYFAFGAYGKDNVVVEFLASIIAFLPNLLVAVILVVISAGIAGVVRRLIVSSLAGRGYANVVGNVVGGLILGLGLVAALTEVGIAVAVTLPVFYALLAILVIAFGIGGIEPARRLLNRALEAGEEVVASEEPVEDDEALVAESAPRARRARKAAKPTKKK